MKFIYINCGGFFMCLQLSFQLETVNITVAVVLIQNAVNSKQFIPN